LSLTPELPIHPDYHDPDNIDPALVEQAEATFNDRESGGYTGQPVECYRFQKGPDVYLWTSADETIVIPQGTFTPMTMTRSALQQTREDHAGSLDITLSLDNPIAVAHVAYMPPNPVIVSLYRAHRGDEANATLYFYGTVVSVAISGSECVLTAAPFNQALKRDVPMLVYQNQCNWPLYGTGCGVPALSFQTPTAIATISDDGLTITSGDFAAKGTGWFRNGWVQDVNGDVRFIVSHIGATVILMNRFAALAAGDSIMAFAGCDRTEAVCAAKFNNLLNYLGFPRVPNRNPYDGSVA
jgi:uncharacterized phage protein (TIGR02218 family)